MVYQKSPVRSARNLRFVVVVGLLSTGCASTRVERLGTEVLPGRPVSEVVVLQLPPGPAYRPLARIEVHDRGLGRSEAALRALLVEEAADLGADAVAIEPLTTERAFGWFVLFDDKVLVGTALVAVIVE
jgi:hypothetical protein